MRRPFQLLAVAIIAIAAILFALSDRKEPAPVVLAAASMQEAMNAAADAWAAQGHVRPVLSFAGSSALARQIAAGAPADLFLSADEPWMDDLEQRGLIVPETRRILAANTLVLVGGARANANALPRDASGWSAMLASGPIAMADPDAVPAGRYGKDALVHFGAWEAVAPHVVRAENVRAALALVERGAADYGIVYATDVRPGASVRIVDRFPAQSHPPIRYPIARTRAARSGEADGFLNFLAAPEQRTIFARYGFAPPPPQ